MKPEVFLVYALYISNYFSNVECKRNYKIYFIRLENVEGENESLLDFSGLKIKQNGFNSVVDGNFTYKVDMDNGIKRSIQIRLTSSSSNVFIESIDEVDNVPLCDFYNTTYKSLIEPTFIGHTNFPKIPPEGLCPIPKGTYHDDNAPINTDRLPDDLREGILRIEARFSKDNKNVGGWNVIAFIIHS